MAQTDQPAFSLTLARRAAESIATTVAAFNRLVLPHFSETFNEEFHALARIAGMDIWDLPTTRNAALVALPTSRAEGVDADLAEREIENAIARLKVAFDKGRAPGRDVFRERGRMIERKLKEWRKVKARQEGVGVWCGVM